MHIYVCVYTQTHTHTSIYIYIYIYKHFTFHLALTHLGKVINANFLLPAMDK